MSLSAAPAATPAPDPLHLNPSGPLAWDFPAAPGDNWRFFPLEWQTQPLSAESFTNFELTADMVIEAYNRVEPDYDTEHYCRAMARAQFHFQGGLVLRDQGPLARYRLQFSVQDKCVALWKAPNNFLAVADCDIGQGKPFAVSVRVTGNRFEIGVDGKYVIDVTDRVEPLNAGPVLAGANQAQVTFRNIGIKSLPAAKESPPVPHQPNFISRSWCGNRWIFDGSAPIARLADGKDGKAWNWHTVGLSFVKYRPGARAADTIPFSFHASGLWPDKPIEILACTSNKVQLRGFTSDRTLVRPPTVSTVCEVTLTYDSTKDSYVYALDNTMTYLTNRVPVVEIVDPWPYSVAGAAPGSRRNWDARYTDIVWRDEDGGLYKYPLNHFLQPPEPRLNREQPLFAFVGETDVNPTCEILPPSTGKGYKIGLCTTMLDLHVQRTDLPTNIPAGTVQRDAWRFFSTHGKGLDALRPKAEPHPIWGYQTNSFAALFVPAGTHFSDDQVVSPMIGHPAQAFSPYPWYAIDKVVGHDAPGSLLMDGAIGSRIVKVGEGLSYFGGAFDGKPYRLELFVKTADLEGPFKVRVVLPGNRVAESEPLTGTTDWKKIELKVETKPSDFAAFINLEFTGPRGGKGKVWIDDVSFQPVDKP